MLHTLTVPSDAAGIRLDVWLERSLDGCSRSLVKRLIDDGRCAVQPGLAKPGYPLRGGEQVTLEVPDIEPMSVEPEDLPLTVLFEDDELIVVDKAPGMVVHPAIGHARGTLVNALLGRYGRTLPDGAAWRPGLIHRLDQDTSGVICVARTPAALTAYQTMFKERLVQKRYLALVHGAPRADFLEHAGAIGRHPQDFRKRIVLPDGAPDAKAAYTSVVVRHRASGYSVVEARPKTGRTHQVRVHLAALGHPVLADGVYGRSDRWPVGADDAAPGVLRRHALHAWALRLPRPDGRDLELEAPVPADLAALVPRGIRPTAW
ncbi:MAG TPA: RluA family pseudouridine synthase [Planctomycetota bacterium]|nr:RluA family pseudouridine synthase [Planctomycetota bacterium]